MEKRKRKKEKERKKDREREGIQRKTLFQFFYFSQIDV